MLSYITISTLRNEIGVSYIVLYQPHHERRVRDYAESKIRISRSITINRHLNNQFVMHS